MARGAPFVGKRGDFGRVTPLALGVSTHFNSAGSNPSRGYIGVRWREWNRAGALSPSLFPAGRGGGPSMHPAPSSQPLGEGSGRRTGRGEPPIEGPNRGPRHRPPRPLAGDSWGEGASLVPTATLALRADFLPACGREELQDRKST